MRNCIGLLGLGSAGGWLAVGLPVCALVCLPSGVAQAQFSAQNSVQNAAPPVAPPAAGLAPSSGDAGAAAPGQKPAAPSVVTLPPQPPPPQVGNAAASQTQSQPAGQVPNQAPNQVPNQALNPVPNQVPAQAPAQAASLPAAPGDKRGFFNDLGQWWTDSIADFNAKVKEQQAKLEAFNKQQTAAAKDATQAMKNAADAMFTPAKIIELQQPCPVAGNGAPDCETAAANVCKAKGFSDGHPIDIRTAERCKASLWVSGQTPTAADCPIETVLLRVACQP